MDQVDSNESSHTKELISIPTQDGQTPLHLAVEKGHLSLVNLLLAQKAQVNAKNKEGKTALHLACEKGRLEITNLEIRWISFQQLVVQSIG